MSGARLWNQCRGCARTIADANSLRAQQTAAMLTTFNEVDMTAVMDDAGAAQRCKFKEKHGVNLGFMSFFTKAVIGRAESRSRI